MTGEAALGGAGGGGALSYPSIKQGIKQAVAKDPFDATVATVFGGAFLFYLAEKGKNPKVLSYWDALVFISTCLSVGYHDVFARTPPGKAIAAAVKRLVELSIPITSAAKETSRMKGYMICVRWIVRAAFSPSKPLPRI